MTVSNRDFESEALMDHPAQEAEDQEGGGRLPFNTTTHTNIVSPKTNHPILQFNPTPTPHNNKATTIGNSLNNVRFLHRPHVLTHLRPRIRAPVRDKNGLKPSRASRIVN